MEFKRYISESIRGKVLAHFIEEKYISSNRGWPWFLASLLLFPAIILTATIVGLAIAIVIVVFYMIVGIFVIYCCCAALEGA